MQVDPLPVHDWERPAIYVMNHQSSLDIPAAFAVLPVDLRFIAKHTLRKVPFLGWYMAWTGMVFVDRSNSTQAVATLNAAAERVRERRVAPRLPGGHALSGREHPAPSRRARSCSPCRPVCRWSRWRSRARSG